MKVSSPSLARAWTVAALVLVLCLGAGIVLENFFHPANLVMVFLAGVAYVSARHPLPVAVATAFGSMLVYDLIFVEPRWSLKPTDPQNWLALVIMLGVGLVISRLAAQGRELAAAALARERRATALKEFALVLSHSRSREVIVQELQATLRQSVGLESRVALDTDPGTSSGSSISVLPMRAQSGPIGVVVLPDESVGRATEEDMALARALVQQAAIALERARFEQRSVEAAVEAERERLRSTLLAGISHDFRTPLTTIMGNATTLLLQGGMIDDARRLALLQDLLAEAQHLHTLTSNLLELTRLEEGAVCMSPEWCHADEIVEESLAAMRLRLGGRRIEVDVGDETLVWCDPTLVALVLHNLLDNAARHAGSGGRVRVEVTVGAEEVGKPPQWQLRVIDSGPGVPAAEREALFKKFHRAHREGGASGHGLGLAICAAVAKLHGGTLALRSDHEGEGACFEMTLPQPAPPAQAGWVEGEPP